MSGAAASLSAPAVLVPPPVTRARPAPADVALLAVEVSPPLDDVVIESPPQPPKPPLPLVTSAPPFEALVAGAPPALVVADPSPPTDDVVPSAPPPPSPEPV